MDAISRMTRSGSSDRKQLSALGTPYMNPLLSLAQSHFGSPRVRLAYGSGKAHTHTHTSSFLLCQYPTACSYCVSLSSPGNRDRQLRNTLGSQANEGAGISLQPPFSTPHVIKVILSPRTGSILVYLSPLKRSQPAFPQRGLFDTLSWTYPLAWHAIYWPSGHTTPTGPKERLLV